MTRHCLIAFALPALIFLGQVYIDPLCPNTDHDPQTLVDRTPAQTCGAIQSTIQHLVSTSNEARNGGTASWYVMYPFFELDRHSFPFDSDKVEASGGRPRGYGLSS